jgi:hypothetical protein
LLAERQAAAEKLADLKVWQANVDAQRDKGGPVNQARGALRRQAARIGRRGSDGYGDYR